MIHAYKNNGYNIVLDVNSGTIHAVDEVSYDIIEMLRDGKERSKIIADILIEYSHMPDITRIDIEKAFDDVQALIAEGKLFSKDNFDVVAEEFKQRPAILKSLCLHVAHDCNMNCKFCFVKEGVYDQGLKGLMTYDVAKKSIDYLVENSGNRRELEVEFFGGEPLLNWQVIKQVVAYCREI